VLATVRTTGVFSIDIMKRPLLQVALRHFFAAR
jgi:hypothetical protein